MSAKNNHDAAKLRRVARDRKAADQGDFFFAKIILDGKICPHPVFVVGKSGDSNDSEDVIVCKGTKQPKKSEYDILVQLKFPTYIRTNKIYTIGRNQLEFKINHTLNELEIQNLCESVERAIKYQ